MEKFYCIVLGVIVCGVIVLGKADVVELFKWSRVEFENLPLPENSYIGPYQYLIPENIDSSTISYHPASGLYIVHFVRFRPGIPLAVGAFCANSYAPGSSPRIWGFPSNTANTFQAADFADGSVEENQRRALPKSDDYTVWKQSASLGYNNPKYIQEFSKTTPPTLLQNTRIIGSYYTTVDEKYNRAFMLDHGEVVYYGNTTYKIQKPAVLVISLPEDGCKTRNFPFIRRAELPDRVIKSLPYGFMAITLDFQSKYSCDDLFLYIPNPLESYLVVYDYNRNQFWSFDHETFLPVNTETQLVFDNTFSYSLQLGIFSVALGCPDENGDRTAYYTPLAGTGQYAVSTKVLKNSRSTSANIHPDDFKIMGYRGTGHQALTTVIDYTYEVMFYVEAQSHQVRCWNINKPLNPDNIGVIFESENYLFGNQIILDSRGYLLFHTSHVPIDFITDIPLDLRKINSRSYTVKVSDAIRGTVCEN